MNDGRLLSLFVWRYAFSRGNRHRKANIAILLGIMVGMAALITILSLMNSLQDDLIEQVRSVESFHIQAVFDSDEVALKGYDAIIEALEAIEHVSYARPFIDIQALVQNKSSRRSTTVRLRALLPSIWDDASDFNHMAKIIDGSKQTKDGIVFGSTVASALALRVSDDIAITFLRPGRTATLAPYSLSLTARGTFTTELAEYDGSTAIADFEAILAQSGVSDVRFGIFVDKAYVDRLDPILHTIRQNFERVELNTWQELNEAFYSALLLEKILMYIFLISIFFIIGVNIRNASGRLLFHKRREAAMMRALGAKKRTVSAIFLLQGTLIAFLGVLLGTGTGIALSYNITTVFSWLNTLQRIFSGYSSSLLAYPFSITIRTGEVLLAGIIVICLACINSYFGIRRMLQTEPMEILYHE